MAAEDEFLFTVAKRAMLSSLADPDAINYRQQILGDCLRHPDVIRTIYRIAVDAIAGEKKIYRSIFYYPAAVLRRSVEALEFFVGMLKELRALSDEHAEEFSSDGFTEFFRMLTKELGDEYFATINMHLKQLRFRSGVLISADLGQGNKGTNYVLRKPRHEAKGWLRRITDKDHPSYSFTIADRDDAGLRALSELADRGVNLVANALAKSTDHILSFFTLLRTELAFYIGCLNLHERLTGKGEPACFPVPHALSATPTLNGSGLYDPCLSLTLPDHVVGNDIAADGRSLVMITGANEGGKSTFLRSVGLAQLMTQCGMFVAARSLHVVVCEGVFTHYKREEDATMHSGKLDEELSRMSTIVDQLNPNSVVLFNESFAATNEREGSEIARQIVHALLEKGIRVLFVTHLYDLAHGFYEQALPTALFLRAERHPDGRRTFALSAGEPAPTSYGEDLYRRVFGTTSDPGAVR
ncbi:MAG TPA: hypothetical protein VHX38_39790 [Pseudonocardiaceae bacterium]|nr:hypothetical protein [Pseudonocardiaceae bacterium]